MHRQPVKMLKETFCCSVILILASAGVQSFLLNRFEREPHQECSEKKIGCVSRAIARYAGLSNIDEVLEKMRETPLRDHCSDWDEALTCSEREIDLDPCASLPQDQIAETKKQIRLLKDVQNYICVAEFDKVNRNFRCLANVVTVFGVIATCEKNGVDINGKCTMINQRTEYVECSSDAVRLTCGSEAVSINNGVNQIIFKHVDQHGIPGCSSSVRERQLELLKRAVNLWGGI